MIDKESIPNYGKVYYQLFLKQLMFGWIEEDVFWKQKLYLNDIFFQATWDFVQELLEDNIYPTAQIDKLQEILTKIILILDEENQWYYYYVSLKGFAQAIEKEDSEIYLEDIQATYHGQLSDRYQCITYSKEQLIQEEKNYFSFYHLLLTRKLNDQPIDILCSDQFVYFISGLFQEASDILQEKVYKNDLISCFKKILSSSVTAVHDKKVQKKVARFLHQVTKGIYELVPYQFNYLYLSNYKNHEKLKLSLLYSEKSLKDDFSDKIIYTEDFRFDFGVLLKSICDVKTDTSVPSCMFKNFREKSLDYLTDYYDYVLANEKDLEVRKKEVAWVNDLKSTLNQIDEYKLNYYIIEYHHGSFINFLKSAYNDNMNLDIKNYLTADCNILELISSSPSDFQNNLIEITKNPYFLESLYYIVRFYTEMLTDPLICQRIRTILKEVSKDNYHNRWKVKKIEKVLLKFDSEKFYE